MENNVYKGRFIRVTEEDIGGRIYERVYIHDSMIIIPFISKDEILFIKEKRPHERPDVRMKLVSGFFEKGYSLEENANRELQEEIGKKANRIISYMNFEPSGTLNEFRRYVIASDFIDSKVPNPDGEDSILEFLPMRMDSIYEKLMNDEFSPSVTSYVLLRLYFDIKSGKLKI